MTFSTIDFYSQNRAQQFVEALHNSGFALFINHPIDLSLLKRLYQQWQIFFEQDEKYSYLFDPKTHQGFFPSEISETAKSHNIKDLKEYFHCYRWGKIPETLKKDTLEYFEQLNTLAMELLDWIERYCPEEVLTRFSIPLPEMILNSQKTLLRVVHYPPITGNEEFGAQRSAAHEDVNLITILPAATQSGLEIKNSSGQWLELPNEQELLLVNTGDMLNEASASYFPSLTHRVATPTNEKKKHSRLSMPFFVHPSPNVVLSSTHTADSYLAQRLRQLGM